MDWQKKTVLVTVKAYPNPSTKYGETVCCAGVELSTGDWIRLYPIPFRDLDNEHRFKKYSVIDVKCRKAEDDRRPESYKVDADSITILEHWDTSDGWQRRKSVVMKTLSSSMCEVLVESKLQSKSLALIKPRNVSFH